MLETKLITKLTEALTLWGITPPYYRNDAQDVLYDTEVLASGSDFEADITRILNPEFPEPDYDELVNIFLKQHPQWTKDNLFETGHDASLRFHEVCEGSDKRRSDIIVGQIMFNISKLEASIAYKIHCRNVQIDDLKRQVDSLNKMYPRTQPDEDKSCKTHAT